MPASCSESNLTDIELTIQQAVPNTDSSFSKGHGVCLCVSTGRGWQGTKCEESLLTNQSVQYKHSTSLLTNQSVLMYSHTLSFLFFPPDFLKFSRRVSQEGFLWWTLTWAKDICTTLHLIFPAKPAHPREKREALEKKWPQWQPEKAEERF